MPDIWTPAFAGETELAFTPTLTGSTVLKMLRRTLGPAARPTAEAIGGVLGAINAPDPFSVKYLDRISADSP